MNEKVCEVATAMCSCFTSAKTESRSRSADENAHSFSVADHKSLQLQAAENALDRLLSRADRAPIGYEVCLLGGRIRQLRTEVANLLGVDPLILERD